MEARDVVKLLQHYRHDVMNHIQIIQGYLSMGKTDIVKTKVQDVIEHFNEERKLMNLNTPLFALWLLQFNSLNKNIRMSYAIHIEHMNLQTQENQIKKSCVLIIEALEIYGGKDDLYELNLTINEVDNTVVICVMINGYIQDIKNFESILNKPEQPNAIKVEKMEHGIKCTFSIPYEQKR